MSSSVVGLDIGNGVIRAAEVMDTGKGQPTLLRYHSMPISASAAHRGEVLESGTFSSALKQLWSAAGFKSKKVVLGVGNHRVLVREVTVPKLPLVQIKESLPFQVQELLPVPVADALLDFYPVSAGRVENSDVVNGLLVAAVKEPVLTNVRAVEAAGLEPIDVDLVPFALVRALLAQEQGSGNVGLIHVGASMSTIVVATEGVPQFVRIIQHGSEDITAALVSKLGVDRSQADQIKRGIGLQTQGLAPEWAPAVEVIQATASDLIDSVRNTLSFFVNTRQGTQVERLLLTGGGAGLPGLPSAIAESTRIPVGIPEVTARFSVARTVDQDSMRAEQSAIAVAAGLAIGARA